MLEEPGTEGQVTRQPGPRQGVIVCAHTNMDVEHFNRNPIPPFSRKRLTCGAGAHPL